VNKKNIFITRQLFPEAISLLAEQYHVEIWPHLGPPPYNLLLNKSKSADGVLSMLTDRIDEMYLREISKRTKVISQMAVGVDNIDLKTATVLGIPIGHTPGVLTETTADFAFSLLMSISRRIVEASNQVHQGKWQPWGPDVLCGQDIHGATLGIIGMGRIGQAMAKRAAGFEMTVLYTDPHRNDDVEKRYNAQYCSIEELLHRSQYISVHVFLSPQNIHLLGKTQFELMRPTAYLINTSRGAVVDQEALYDALKTGKIAGAALDVTDPEPIDPTNPLLNMENVIITPHIASASIQTRMKMATMAVKNLMAGLNGQELPNCANPEVYKKV
jgi:glyoxylate reductase